MKRRGFITAAATGIAAASSAFSPNVLARNRRIRLEMVTSWPAALENLYGTATYFAKRLEEISDGRVQCRTYPGGAQVGAMEVYDAVASGAFDCCHTAPYYFIGQTPAHGFFTALPFGLTLAEQNAWMIHGGGQELWDELNARDNLVAFPGGNTGAQTGGWYNKEINSPADLRGLRMRFPGHGGRVMAKTGVNIQQLPGNEVYTAMERGVLDAAEWVGPHDDTVLGMHRVAKYLYLPSWAEPSAMLGFYFNQTIWKDLPGDVQAMIKAVSSEADAWMTARYLSTNPPALLELENTHGISVRQFPSEVMKAFHGAADAVHGEDMKADAMYRRIHEPWAAYRGKVRDWNRRTGFAYESYLNSPA